MSVEAITRYKDLITMIGVGIGALSLAVSAWSARKNFLNNRARFWLDLRTQFAKHDPVHRNLRPGGKWSSRPLPASDVEGPGPDSVDDWADVESYMGLFEHCETLFQAGLIDAATFSAIYSYRIRNIYGNKRVRVEKLQRQARGWERFLALMDRVGIKRTDGQ